jgi:hypothetical protein
MELNGAVPHHIVWPQPGEMPQGRDVRVAPAAAEAGDGAAAERQDEMS